MAYAWRTLRRAWWAAIVIYAVVTVTILAASFLLVRAEARGILRSLFSLLLFPSLLLLPLTLLLRQWVFFLLLTPFVILWCVIYGALLLPRSSTAPQVGYRFTMLTYNVQAASNNLASLADVIRNANADVVALQELSQAAAQYLQSTLADLYPNQALFPQANAHWGQGTLSRFPIAETQYWRNEQIEAALGHMWATLEMDNRAVTVFNTHPVPPFSFEDGITLNSHSQEIRVLLQRAAQHDTPLLLVGDFNMTQLMDEYQQVTMRYVDTFREAGSPGLGFTFPAGHRLPLPPIVRLDYIFHSGHFRGLNAYPLSRSGASDHLPFWAELVLLEAPG